MKLISPTETNLASTILNGSLQVLVLSSPVAKTGTTVSALGLVRQLSRASAGKVLLVDASVSENNLSRQFDLANVSGFRNLTSGQIPAADVASLIKKVEVPGASLQILPVGGAAISGSLFGTESVRNVFAELKATYRFVIVDSDAVYANDDTLTLAALADGVVVVIGAEQTRWEVAQAMTQRLAHAGAQLIGAVFNRRRYYVPRWVYERI